MPALRVDSGTAARRQRSAESDISNLPLTIQSHPHSLRVVLGRGHIGDIDGGFGLGEAVAEPAPATAFLSGFLLLVIDPRARGILGFTGVSWRSSCRSAVHSTPPSASSAIFSRSAALALSGSAGPSRRYLIPRSWFLSLMRLALPEVFALQSRSATKGS